MMRRIAVVFAIAAASVAGAQQLPPVRDIPAPVKEIAEPFSLISAITEIRPGVVIVSDGLDAEVSVVDFLAGTRTKLGRQGGGPGEYRAPSAVFKLRGDTTWVFDNGQNRIVAYTPDLKPAPAVTFVTFDAQTRTQLIAPMFGDRIGRFYASGLAVSGDGNMQMPDSVDVVRVDPRVEGSRVTLARVRYPTAGRPEMRREGNVIRYVAAYPGLVASDSWTVFPDGRIVIVRGATYAVEFIAADGKRTTAAAIQYDHFKVSAEDKPAEMDRFRRIMKDQMRSAQRSMPAGMTLEFEFTEPTQWPAEYPPLAANAAQAGPDGRLWLRRAIPTRIGRERWDVLDATGKLVQRWQLPPKTNLVGIGEGGVIYTVRMDDDDLRYLQRVVLK